MVLNWLNMDGLYFICRLLHDFVIALKSHRISLCRSSIVTEAPASSHELSQVDIWHFLVPVVVRILLRATTRCWQARVRLAENAENLIDLIHGLGYGFRTSFRDLYG
ncbi:unnamed protein product [Protopolystoma xenopodis]|uniref:Uncharacterized protein n=1 Tax=Protopolystoma xenopodis TaxID=117903 RepID=A0A3S5AU83_9PLAT|nr:unnamed protein product [Protopolystoma xenopodis]